MSRNVKIRQLQIVTPEEELENLRNEVGVLRRTVESKSAAVGILRAELQECQRERDKFRTLAEDETLHRSPVSSFLKKPTYSDPCRSAMLSGSEGTLAQLLSISKEENKTLRRDSTELRCKLHDAQADIKVLREEIQRLRGGESRRRSNAHTATSQLAHQEREQFISQMEALSSRCQAQEGDVRGLIEEREELVRELDASSHKLHRLNHILNTILSSNSSATTVTHPKRFIDLDAIITENRYLQERLKQTEEEKNLARSNALKYKAALEKCRTQGSLKLGTPENLIVTPKQVGELLRDYHGEVGGAAEADLKSVCVALVDALNQRSRALRTQRSANKVLVSRVTELERRLSSIGNPEDTKTVDGVSGEVETSEPQITSLGLMEGYIPPSGPSPKYSEEDTMKDPRLNQVLNSIIRTGDSKSKQVAEEVNCPEENNDGCSVKENKNNGREKEICNTAVTKHTGDSVTVDDSQNVDEEMKDVKNESAFNSTNIQNECVTCSVESHTQDLHHDGDSIEEIISACEILVCDSEVAVSEEKGPSQQEKDCKNILRKPEQKDTCVAKSISKQTTKPKKVSTFINPEDELEEIVPIDQLDLYIKEVQLKRKCLKTSSVNESENSKEKPDKSNLSKMTREVEELEENCMEKEVMANDGEIRGQKTKSVTYGENNDSSFELDISDYDSDNDNLDLAIQDWQNDFDKSYQGKKEKSKQKKSTKEQLKLKGASGKEKFSFWPKDSAPKTEISPALQEFFDKATGEVVDNGVDLT